MRSLCVSRTHSSHVLDVIMQDVDFGSAIQSAWLGWEHGCNIELN